MTNIDDLGRSDIFCVSIAMKLGLFVILKKSIILFMFISVLSRITDDDSECQC